MNRGHVLNENFCSPKARANFIAIFQQAILYFFLLCCFVMCWHDLSIYLSHSCFIWWRNSTIGKEKINMLSIFTLSQSLCRLMHSEQTTPKIRAATTSPLAVPYRRNSLMLVFHTENILLSVLGKESLLLRPWIRLDHLRPHFTQGMEPNIKLKSSNPIGAAAKISPKGFALESRSLEVKLNYNILIYDCLALWLPQWRKKHTHTFGKPIHI